MKQYLAHLLLSLFIGVAAHALDKSKVGAVVSDLEYAKELKAEGAVLTDEAFRAFVAKGPNADLNSSTFAELKRSPLNKPNYLVLRFNHPRKQHLSGDVLITLNMGSGNPLMFPIDLHIGDYWRTYYIPLDSFAWPSLKNDPVKVSIKWSRLTLQ